MARPVDKARLEVAHGVVEGGGVEGHVLLDEAGNEEVAAPRRAQGGGGGVCLRGWGGSRPARIRRGCTRGCQPSWRVGWRHPTLVAANGRLGGSGGRLLETRRGLKEPWTRHGHEKQLAPGDPRL